MNIKKEVCSVELATELKKLGVKQDSIYYYLPPLLSKKSKKYTIAMKDGFNLDYHHDAISAFTATELCEMLPGRITILDNTPFNSFRFRLEQSIIVEKEKVIPVYLANYRCDSTECTGENAGLERTLLPHNIYGSNFANCFAKLLIKLIEDEVIKI